MDPLENMKSMMPAGSFGYQSETNLWSILLNVAFGFILGLMIFIGPKQVVDYGTKVAKELIQLTGYGQQASAFGFATTAAPYIVLAPLAGLVVKQLSAVRSLKSFGFFAAAVIVGLITAFFSQGYFTTLFV